MIRVIRTSSIDGTGVEELQNEIFAVSAEIVSCAMKYGIRIRHITPLIIDEKNLRISIGIRERVPQVIVEI